MDTRTKILEVATKLFSQKGYEGVSMRNIADEVKISAPALYNHFSDKQSLYITTISETFENKTEPLVQIMESPGDPMERLEKIVFKHCELMHEDPKFHQLIQRELLDGDEQRLQFLAQKVFSPAFVCLEKLLIEIQPDCDSNTLIIIILGMIDKHVDLDPLVQYFPGTKKERNNPAYITKQVMAILSAYLGDKS